MSVGQRTAVRIGGMAQVLLVRDLPASQAYYRQLGFRCDGWGHAERDGLTLLLRQAADPREVRPHRNAEVEPGPHEATRTYDTYAYATDEDALNDLHEEFLRAGVNLSHGPVRVNTGGTWWKWFEITDPDGHVLRFGCPVHHPDPPA